MVKHQHCRETAKRRKCFLSSFLDREKNRFKVFAPQINWNLDLYCIFDPQFFAKVWLKVCSVQIDKKSFFEKKSLTSFCCITAEEIAKSTHSKSLTLSCRQIASEAPIRVQFGYGTEQDPFFQSSVPVLSIFVLFGKYKALSKAEFSS